MLKRTTFLGASKKTQIEATVLDEGNYPFKDYVAHLPVQMKRFISSVQSKDSRGMASNASQILFGLAQGFREAGDPDFAKGITRMARVLGREAGHEIDYGEAVEASLDEMQPGRLPLQSLRTLDALANKLKALTKADWEYIRNQLIGVWL